MYLSILALLAIAAIFTIGKIQIKINLLATIESSILGKINCKCPGGGLSAVIWTDFVQTILMIIGALWLMILSFREVGGYEELIEKYRSVNQKTAD